MLALKLLLVPAFLLALSLAGRRWGRRWRARWRYSFAAFCFLLAVMIERSGIAAAFITATLAALGVQAGTRTVLLRLRSEMPRPP